MAKVVSVYLHLNYKDYLLECLKMPAFGGRGGRSILAKAAGCQLAFVSQVLNGHVHFSLEQAEGISQLLTHNQSEKEFFFLQIQFARAGTKSLESFFLDQLKEKQAKASKIKDRVDQSSRKVLSKEQQIVYYSSWRYAAIHMLLRIPSLRSVEAIVKYLRLSREVVVETLLFLDSVGLAKKNGDEFLPGPASLHLGSESPLLSRHHANWRLRAVDHAEVRIEKDLQYSSVITVSKADAEKIQQILTEVILDTKKIIKDSGDEILYCYNLDFFEIGSAK